MEDLKARIAFYSVAGMAAGIFLFFAGFRKLWRKRLIQNIPTSRVRSIAMGLVEIYGKAVPDLLLTAPYTKTPCVFFHVIVERLERRHTSRGSSHRWVREFETKTDIPFYLEDETGCVAVDPRGADTELEMRYNVTEGNRRYREYHIADREEIYILGSAKRETGVEEKIHTETEKRVREIIEDPEEKVRLDTNRDMWIDDDEWKAARKKIREEVRGEMAVSAGDKPETFKKVPGLLENVVIGKGENERHYIISSRSEKEMIDSYRRSVFLLIAGGAILTVACLKILLSYK